MKEIDISKVLNFAKNQKYEVSAAAFDLVDHIFKVDVPKGLKARKLSVQAMGMLMDGHMQYGYDESITDDETAHKAEAPADSSGEEE